jgi:hypothetical protein
MDRVGPGGAMAQFAVSPFDTAPKDINTGQPFGRYIRRPQLTKFFTYLHQFVPGTTSGWGVGAVGIRDQFQVDGDADFHIMKQAVLAFDSLGVLVGSDTLAFEVSPVSESFNFAEAFVASYGSGRLPNQMGRYPLILPRNAVFTAKARQLSLIPAETAPTILIAHFGAKVYRNPYISAKTYLQQKPYTYVANFTAFDGGVGAIPAGATSIFSLRTDGASDFDVLKMTVVADAPVTIQVRTDEDNWFLRAIRGELLGASQIENLVGPGFTWSGELPFAMTVPKLISAAGYINVQVANLDAVNANRVQVSFWGQRLYPAGGVRV